MTGACIPGVGTRGEVARQDADVVDNLARRVGREDPRWRRQGGLGPACTVPACLVSVAPERLPDRVGVVERSAAAALA